MGSCGSKIERKEMVTRCKARRKYMKQLVDSRHRLSAAHSLYFRSLRSTPAALHRFAAAADSSLHRNNDPTLPTSPPMTPITANAECEAAAAPPPPMPGTEGSGRWDFWDPFVAAEEEEWYDSTDGGGGSSPPQEEAAAAVGKEVVEIVKELEECFLRAADAGAFINGVLRGNVSDYGRSLRWSRVQWGGNGGKLSGLGEDNCGIVDEKVEVISANNNVITTNGTTHCETIERLYAWEKKLFLEVKNAEKLKVEHEKRVEQLRRLEEKKVDHLKTENIVENLVSLLEVSSQTIQTTSDEITKLRETQLYPQILNLIQGFMSMWRSMYKCHQEQMDIVDQLKSVTITATSTTIPTTEIHRESTSQLESELQQWKQSLTDLVSSQRDYVRALTGWLRLSIFQFNQNTGVRSNQDSTIYSLCEEWQVQSDRVPDKVAIEGIDGFLSAVHDIVAQQSEEHKQKRKYETVNKELEKREDELRKGRDVDEERRVKVDMLKTKAEEEKSKHEKAVGETRRMMLNSLQADLPRVFQAITEFSSVCSHGFEDIYSKAKDMDQEDHGLKS